MGRKLRIRQLLKLFNLANRINLHKAEPRFVLNLKTSKLERMVLLKPNNLWATVSTYEYAVATAAKLKAKLFMADKENEH